MRTERLHAIMIYLLNHGKTSASELAKHFEVSQRTIQRDIDSLCLAGIPVISTTGATGGYEISDRFRLNGDFATPDDYSRIITALQGLETATADPRIKQTLEKINRMSGTNDSSLILDFSVLQEGDRALLQQLQAAVAEKRTVDFTYTNNDNETRTHRVEPVAVIYRWYAWYLLAYSRVRQDYRTYKLVRMSNLKLTDEPFEKEHETADVILRRNDKTDSRIYTEILIKCSPAALPRIREYLKGTVLEEYPDGDFLLKTCVVENEQLWIGTLLSLSDQVEVIRPEKIRMRILETAEKLVSLYKRPYKN